MHAAVVTHPHLTCRDGLGWGAIRSVHVLMSLPVSSRVAWRDGIVYSGQHLRRADCQRNGRGDKQKCVCVAKVETFVAT